MLASLQNHPFPVQAYFESSLVLTFAVPKEMLENRIPECLSLDTFDDKWAFIAVAMVQTKGLRPKGMPQFLGHDFFLIGYRIFVRYTNNQGKRLRGLYIIKSETDKRKMAFLSKFFTHYNFQTTDIQQVKKEGQLKITSTQSDFSIEAKTNNPDAPLPHNSPFATWKEARRFAGPLPFTFTYFPSKKQVLIIQGMRQNWKPSPVEVLDYQFSFLAELGLGEAILANAFIINNIPYHWKKGQLETWNG